MRPALGLAWLAAITAVPVHAQCVECAQQMFQSTLSGNAWSNIDQQQIDETRRRDAKNGIYYDANRHLAPSKRESGNGPASSSRIPRYIVDRTESAAFSVLNAEYNRRATADGKASADQWLNGTARRVGQEVGALGSEYLQRADRDGRPQADRWYVTQAQSISRRHAGSSTR